MIEDRLPITGYREAISIIRRLVAPDRKLFTAAVLLLTFSAAVAAAATRVLGVVIDRVSNDGSQADITSLGVALCVGIALAGISALKGRQLFGTVAERTIARLRDEAFEGAMNLELRTVERVGTADPLSRLTGDIGSLSDAAHEIVPTLVTLIIASSLATVGLFSTSPLLGLVSIAVGAPPIAIFARRFMKRNGPLAVEWAASRADVTRSIHEVSEGSATIRAFDDTENWHKRVDDAVEREWLLEWPMCAERNQLYPTVNISQGVALSTLLLLSMWLHRSNHLSVGAASAAALYQLQIYQPLGLLFDMLDKLQSAGAGLRRICGIALNTGVEKTKGSEPADGAVEFRDVHFSYGDGHEILHGVDLSISNGERVAVVGVSGAGKSTIAKLLAGIHPISKGRITVGGVDVDRLDSSGRRRWVALVTQESHVFIGSIADNCRLATPDASDEQIETVLRAVHAWDWVTALPDGVDTRIGRDGTQLSLVESQQLALARVLLIDPVVVILDEATAGLGTQSARGIEQAFGAVLEGRTVITIAHRLDVALSADRVIVVDKGTAQIGSHEHLLHDNISYSMMWKHWTAVRS